MCVCVCVYSHYLCTCVRVRRLTAVYQQATGSNNSSSSSNKHSSNMHSSNSNSSRGSTIKITCLFVSLLSSCLLLYPSLSLFLCLSVCLPDFVLISNICNILRLVFNLLTLQLLSFLPCLLSLSLSRCLRSLFLASFDCSKRH